MNQIHFVARFKIHPDRGDDFKSAAAACLAAARSSEPGTLAYEWFIDDGQTNVITIEAYESSEAALAHIKNSAAHLPKLLQFAEGAAEGLGTPSAGLRDRLQDRITFVPRFQGLSVPRLDDSGGGTGIRSIARFRIQPGKLEEFKRGASAGLEIVEEKDPGCTAYEWYLDDSGGRCTVVEMYRDAAALLDHSKHVGHLMRGLLQVSDLAAELCTRETASSLAALAKLPLKRFGYFQGLWP